VQSRSGQETLHTYEPVQQNHWQHTYVLSNLKAKHSQASVNAALLNISTHHIRISPVFNHRCHSGMTQLLLKNVHQMVPDRVGRLFRSWSRHTELQKDSRQVQLYCWFELCTLG
jgi:hypothetical protein